MVEDLTKSDRLRELAAELADRVGLGEDKRQALDIAASILGVGRLPLADVIEKRGRLTPEELARFRDIPKIWAEFTGQLGFLKEIGVPEIVEAHCENWDGSGYPNGLAGEEIPLGARLLAVCYRFNGMISDRPDRKAMPPDRAAAEIRSMSGKALDPAIVETFVEMVEEERESALALGETQDAGVVSASNGARRSDISTVQTGARGSDISKVRTGARGSDISKVRTGARQAAPAQGSATARKGARPKKTPVPEKGGPRKGPARKKAKARGKAKRKARKKR